MGTITIQGLDPSDLGEASEPCGEEYFYTVKMQLFKQIPLG